MASLQKAVLRLIALLPPMSLIWQEKIRSGQRAPQHLSDCLRERAGCGQFVSAGREANRTTASA
jgi:hypothetical protein